MRAAMMQIYRSLAYDVFLTIRRNTVILGPVEAPVNRERRPVERPTSLIFTLYGDVVHRGDRRDEAVRCRSRPSSR